MPVMTPQQGHAKQMELISETVMGLEGLESRLSARALVNGLINHVFKVRGFVKCGG